MTKYREQITLFNYTTGTTDETNAVDTAYPGRRLLTIGPPYVLSWLSADAGSGQEASPNFIGQIQDSDDGVTYSDVTGFTLTAITAPGGRLKQKTSATQLRAYVRFVGATVAAGTWGSGSVLTAILTGEG